MHIVSIVVCAICAGDSHLEVQEAIAWLVPAIIAAVGAVSQGVGAAIGNKRKRRAQQKLDAEYANRIRETEEELNANFLDRADSKDALRKITDSNEEVLRQLNTGAIRKGATDEAKVAMASSLTKRTADAVGELSALGEQYKDKLRAHRDNLKAERAAQTYAAESDVSGLDTIIQGIGQVANAFASSYGTTASKGAKQPSAVTSALNAAEAHRVAYTPTLRNNMNQIGMQNQLIPYGK